ncbi:MAG: PAS domain S-box protein, partial [Anaerolineae bacterium]|nr:PAS domain S-box protein [Anaerolineae bacterium]
MNDERKNKQQLLNELTTLRDQLAQMEASISAGGKEILGISEKKYDEKYDALLANMLDAYAYHRIVLDEKNRPVDYIFLEINDHFQEFTGIHREDIIGKRVTEIFPGIENTDPDLISIYGEVALTKKEVRFDFFFEPLEKWYSVSVFSPEYAYFITIFQDISVRVRAELKLKKSEILPREVIDNMNKAIAIYEPVEGGDDFRFVAMNEFAEQITHFKVEDVVGRTVRELFPGESSVGLISILRKTWQTGNATQIPLKQYVDERITQWVENYIFKLPSGLVVAMFEDTFEKRKTELSLLESEERFRQFFESNAEYCYLVSPEGLIIDINRQALEVLGYSKDEIVGKPILTTIYAPESQEKARQALKTWQQTGQLRNEELIIVSKSGEKRIVLLNASTVQDATGRIVHSTSIQTDITEWKQAIAEIEMLAKFPAENPNPVLRISKDGVVLYHNSASVPLLKHWEYVAAEPLQKEWLELVQKSLTTHSVITSETEMDGKDLSLTFAPIVEGNFVNVYGLDITERNRALEALREYSERLEEMVAERTRDLEDIQQQLIRKERLAVLGELAGGVGHELRNPLGVIT